jgi:uncharacterized membrane protein YdfJ with MMPL/SSD domain
MMATRLYRIGGWAFDHRRRVLCAWLFVLATIAIGAAVLGGQTSDRFVVPGTESQQAQDLLARKFPGAGGASARVVFAAPAGASLNNARNRAAVEATLQRATQATGVSQVIDPYQAGTITRDGRIAYADVVYPVPADRISQAARHALAATAASARAAGLRVEFGGGLVEESQSSSSEATGMLIAYAVLAITLSSLLAAGLPLLTALLGVAIGVIGLKALSGVVDVSTTAPTLAAMLGLAVGIDYALFILSRHRQNLADGLRPREAAAQATATAGSAVVFAGATVVIALAGLAVVGIPFLTVMGLAAAGTVATAVLIAITLLPAMLGFAGHRMARMNRVLGRRRRRQARRPSASLRWARLVTARPVPVLVIGIGVLSAIALPALHLRLGLPDAGSRPTSMTERRAYDLLTQGFGPGANGTLTVVVNAPTIDRAHQKHFANTVVAVVKGLPGVAAVSAPAQNAQGDVTIVSVTPTSGPASEATKQLVTRMRHRAAAIPKRDDIHAYVTGQTAINIDTADRIGAALPTYVALITGLALLLLTVVFRSLLVPITAVGGFLLSIAASMGLVVWVFQDGHLAHLFGVARTGPIVSFLPVLLIGILFGLAMDYEVFLVSRMRERYVHTGHARDAVVTGYAQSGRVVTAAATIMVAVFGGFVLDVDPIVKSIGLSLAFGVMADAFIVRLTLVPALMALLDRAAWWLPRPVDHLMPNLDIEGQGLLKSLEPAAA